MSEGWLLDVTTMEVGLILWIGVVLVHGAWRSRGSAAEDPIRASGPIFRP